MCESGGFDDAAVSTVSARFAGGLAVAATSAAMLSECSDLCEMGRRGGRVVSVGVVIEAFWGGAAFGWVGVAMSFWLVGV